MVDGGCMGDGGWRVDLPFAIISETIVSLLSPPEPQTTPRNSSHNSIDKSQPGRRPPASPSQPAEQETAAAENNKNIHRHTTQLAHPGFISLHAVFPPLYALSSSRNNNNFLK